MRLLRLELSGFKSFCDKVSISFVQNGISIVVGPNGCGKSNIVDAIRWALGEQSAKHLRGSSMEDVIFNGSKNRQPVNLAQVSLTFANPDHDTIHKYADFSEITITRKLFRSGESNYLINKAPCRLADIKELFMDTGIGGKGYSIIEQGKIDRIVLSKADEKRAIIDEAAGIIRFKTKKAEAQKKFEQTKQNLLRIDDLIHELKGQEDNLRHQAKEAEAYMNVKARIERLDQCVQSKNWFLIKQKSKQNEENLLKNKEEQERLLGDIAVMEADEETRKLAMVEITTKIENKRADLQSQKEELIKMEGKKESEETELNHLQNWDKKNKEEIEQLKERVQSDQRKLKEFQEESEAISKQGAELDVELGEIDKDRVVFDTEIKESTQKQTSMEKERINLLAAISTSKQKLDHAAEKLAENKAKSEDQSGKEDYFDRKIEQEKQNIQQLLDDLKTNTGIKSKNQKEIQEIQEEVAKISSAITEIASLEKERTQRKHQIKSRLESLTDIVKSHEDFDSATKIFLDKLDAEPSIKEDLGYLGSITDLMPLPPEPDKQTTTFLNQYFNLLVFDSVDRLQKITKLHDEIESEQIQVCFSDLLGLQDAQPFLSAGEKPKLSVSHFVERIEGSLFELDKDRLKKGKSLVDQHSCLMTGDRVFLIGHPGKSNKVSLLLKRREEEQSLQSEFDEVKTSLKELEGKKGLLEEQRNECLQGIEERKKVITEMEMEIHGIEKETANHYREQERFEQAKKRHIMEMEGLKREGLRIEEMKKDVQNKLEEDEKRQEQVLNELEETKQKIGGLFQKKESFSEQRHHIKLEITRIREKQSGLKNSISELQQRCEQGFQKLKQLEAELIETQEKKQTIQERLEQRRKNLPGLLEKILAIEKAIQEEAQRIEQKQAGLTELQQKLKKLYHKNSQIKEDHHKAEVKKAQMDQEALNIQNALFSDFSLTPDEILQTYDVESFSIAKESKAIEELKEKLRGFDNVNLAAKAEWENLQKRLGFLQTQSEDLNRSIESLEESIVKIDQESKKRFKEAFEKIDRLFSELFPRLFGGGEAHLALTDKEDLLNSGVEIIAKPPGKKLQNMILLSGGEKALTAISLIFAIFQTKPSPFCLLDEVDAPLDDANNLRFNQHVQQLTENSQFIIITHNKKTMEIADSLFGVTMEEPGVSKIVSVGFKDDEPDLFKKAV